MNKEAFNAEIHRADTCIICLEKFKESEIISELPCDSRHIFHYDCLALWLHTKQICPLCKQPVQPQRQRGSLGRMIEYVNPWARRANSNRQAQDSPARQSQTSEIANNVIRVSEPINRAINDPMNIAVDLGLNNDPQSPRNS